MEGPPRVIRLNTSRVIPLDPRPRIAALYWEHDSSQAHRVGPVEPEPHFLYGSSKRLLDVTLSLVLLVLFTPVVTVAAIAIFLTTRQNPMLRQLRVGRHGRQFFMLKLRTMSETQMEELAPPDAVFVAKPPDDTRVTRIGKLLRRSSIDELPQLLNVLSGEMSLVGPRPNLPVEVARYPHSWRRRLQVRPGLTGLWQVSGRSEVPPRRRTAMDRRYMRRRSLSFDFLILLRTVTATFSMRGAW
jgi:lipopolysaccharide/colanic/teichoic acid biosynthesis glycosyltransferase